jgi:hypothetical protein
VAASAACGADMQAQQKHKRTMSLAPATHQHSMHDLAVSAACTALQRQQAKDKDQAQKQNTLEGGRHCNKTNRQHCNMGTCAARRRQPWHGHVRNVRAMHMCLRIPETDCSMHTQVWLLRWCVRSPPSVCQFPTTAMHFGCCVCCVLYCIHTSNPTVLPW